MSVYLFHATLVTTLLLLIIPMCPGLPGARMRPVTATKYATLTALATTTLHAHSGHQSTTTNMTWLTSNFNLELSFTFDQYTIFFLPVSLLITHTIMQFTNWYMHTDPAREKFNQHLLLFLVAMLTLTTANNMIQLFVGWEGVGIMSFLLISWWGGRPNANTAALQAIAYNRTGDIGLILSLTWLATNLNTWDMQQLFSHKTLPLLPLLGLILAATGKSAQFGLHPWLPSAMEGPTPVSALLHSSTMVIAGIFLLIRLHPLLQTNTHALTTCLYLGATTTMFAALCALTQTDIKKIIAFSTSSQLGLMMTTIGMNQPELAFLHISTHAFFKAMLFLCSGSIIHNLNNEQDIRKMGGLHTTLPVTTSCMTLGNLALAGTPFLSGFFSKDMIIETMNTSMINAWALATTMLATMLTAAYSMRMIFYTHLQTPRYPPVTQQNEESQNQTMPLLILAVGSITYGFIISTVLVPTQLQTLTMPLTTKLLALSVSTMGLLMTMDLMFKTPTPTPQLTTLTQLYFYDTLLHRTTLKTELMAAHNIALHLKDMLWYETLGPNVIKTLSQTTANSLSLMHTGLIKTYLMTFTLMLLHLLLLTYLGWT